MTKIQMIIGIALFGALGALARVYLGGFVQSFLPDDTSVKFPVGTLLVNVLGCLVFGCLGYVGHHQQMFSQEWRTILLSGLLGSFTTFSTFGFETVLLYENAPHGKLYFSAANILLNVVLGVIAILGGMQIGRLITGS